MKTGAVLPLTVKVERNEDGSIFPDDVSVALYLGDTKIGHGYISANDLAVALKVTVEMVLAHD